MSDKINVEELKRGGVVKLKEKGLFSVWVKTYCANLNSKQLKKVAELSEKYGRGIILFSTRQIPIIPFVKLEDIDAIKRELKKVEVGLDRCGPRIRNINVCYEDSICKDAISNSLLLGEKLEKYFDDPILHKTKIGISGCSRDCIAARVLNDLCFISVGKNGLYDAYLGGKLGLKPFIGLKMAGPISEDNCIKFVDNYFNLMKREGKDKERSADIINRLGKEAVQKDVLKDLDKIDISKIKCSTHVEDKQFDKVILKIKATCGELTAKQVKNISDVAEKYGNGFIHFTIYGSPEVPGIDKNNIEKIRLELLKENVEILDKGIDNIQTCFGGYCVKGVFDTQSLLKKVDRSIGESGLKNQDIKISASGCPSSCGISYLSDIGFLGVVEPVIDEGKCSGCGICEKNCKVKAIKIINKIAFVDKTKCSYCGECIKSCPVDAVQAKRAGIKMLAGGAYGKETALAEPIAEFLSEEKALNITKNCLQIIKERNIKLRTIINEVGLDKFKKMVLK
ncbi:MAG: 4Fe-4S binding protein [bacterium]|nr:4Fe-4S binding protein [bacterium]